MATARTSTVKRPRGRPIGTSHYPYRADEERDYIVRMLQEGHTNQDIHERVGWPLDEIRDLRAEFFPTVGLAEAYLRANSLRLAKRVVEEANVEEAMEILERPNIAVLKPLQKGGDTKVGVMVAVDTRTLGAVVSTSTSTEALDEPMPAPVPLALPAPRQKETPHARVLKAPTPAAVPAQSPRRVRHPEQNRRHARQPGNRRWS